MHPTQHHYATRTRLRPNTPQTQCPPSPLPPPRRIRPVPVPPALHAPPQPQDPSLPLFPIPGVMLHPDDASNKVFHAIGRSFLSVENRAMTIKDLAEMTIKYGLMCQNVSAASQAITTYIRNHMARCEAQQDHPLLLRHVLSGTLSDDDLVPALYSRTGGATNPTKSTSKDSGPHGNCVAQHPQPSLEGDRLTNFRRGTMVWYLSKATGVSCPFARAGVRLCEYGKEGRRLAEKHGDELQVAQNVHVTRDDAQCGEKRKRLRRGGRRDSDGSMASSCLGRDSHSPAIDSGYGELSTDSSDDERPPKVKLMLRLRPSVLCATSPSVASRPREVIDLSNDASDSSFEDDAARADGGDNADMHPDPPEVPWSLPPYPRRGISVPGYTPTCEEQGHLPWSCHAIKDERKRSPSVPWSASPPPDSDRDDFDLDPDSDIDWDSSFSVPSPAPAPQVKVEMADDFQPFRNELADIRDMLDAWEDLDCAPTSTVSSATVKLPTTDDLKFDALELWEWEFESGWTGTSEGQEDLPVLKMEPNEHESPLASYFPLSCSPLTASSHRSSSSSGSGGGSFASQSCTSVLASPASPPSLASLFGTNTANCALTWQDAELLGPDTVHPHDFEDGWADGVRMPAGSSLLPRLASDEVASSQRVQLEQDKADTSCAIVKEIGTCHADSGVCPSPTTVVQDVVVVRTCRPCTPDVCATQVEGISVYQTMLGSTPLLRRIDTDFVNLSTILSYLSLSAPSPLPNACVNVCHPSLPISGIWVPLNVARSYGHGLPSGVESVFLSDDLVMRFPTALQDFYQKSTSWKLLNQFGPNFNDSLSSSGAENPLPTPQLDKKGPATEAVWEVPVEIELAEEPLLAIPPSVNLALANLHPSTLTGEATAPSEVALSPTEQEIFHALCVHPDWETEEGGESAAPASKHSATRPLRRSRRVADAIAARSRVASPRAKGPRHA